MGLLGLLLLACGVFGIACGECVPATANCSQYWEKIENHKGLMESEDELNSWCSRQPRFYKCLEDVLLADYNGNVSHLPTNLLISKLFAEDLCTEESTSRRRYLNNAVCINQRNTEICSQPEYLDIVTTDEGTSLTNCSRSEKIFTCIAATLIQNCGFDAGRVYRSLLKITRYSEEVCGIETSQAVQPCEREYKDSKRDQNVSDIYYGLVNRIGSIPEQDAEISEFLVSNKISEYEPSEYVTEAIMNALEFLDENALADKEAIVEYGDSEEPRSECELPEEYEYEMPADEEYEVPEYKKYPIITQVYREILFYNYSDLEYAIYWRQPEFTIFELISCVQWPYRTSHAVRLKCQVKYRSRDPKCVSNETVHEPVTPELIRDLDPDVPDDSIVEFGPRPAWMEEMDYAYEEKRLRDEMRTTTEFPDHSDYLDYSDAVYSTAISTLLYLVEAVSADPPEPHRWEWTQTMLLPVDIRDELLDLLLPEDFIPSRVEVYQVGTSSQYSKIAFIYDSIAAEVENMICGRFNECHPRGKGLFKCKIMRKTEMKRGKREVVYGGTRVNIEERPETSQLFKVAEAAEPVVLPDDSITEVTLEVTEPTPMPNDSEVESERTDSTEAPASSGFAEICPEKIIEQIFSDIESETGTIDERKSTHREVELDVSNYVNDQPLDTEELESLEPAEGESDQSAVRLVVLDGKSIDREGDSFVPEIVYEIDGIMDNEQIFDVCDSSDDCGLLKNIIMLQTIPSINDADTEYTIVNSSNDGEDNVL